MQIKVIPRHLLAQAAAEHIIETIQTRLAHQSNASIALAGGSTPKAAYQQLAQMSGRLDWRRIHLFWGDERCVPPDHPESNYHMARQTLLDFIAIPPENVHRMRGEEDPFSAAGAYEAELRTFFSGGNGRGFDLILLGLGEDGHTASLFPGSPALQIQDRWVVAVEHNQPPPPLVTRLSITLPVINAAAYVTYLVLGAAKSGRLAQILAAAGMTSIEPPLPAQLVRPTSGNLSWLVDEDAYPGGASSASE